MKPLEILLVAPGVLVLFGLALGETASSITGPRQGTSGQDTSAEQELTGIVSDSTCKGWHNRKAVTAWGCSRQCVEDGADYALVVGHTVYILEGHKAELDKFAGGPATITGRVDGKRVLVDSVAAKNAKKRKGDTQTVPTLFTAQAKPQSPQAAPKGNPKYRDLRDEILKLKAEVDDLEKRLLPLGEHAPTIGTKPVPGAGPISSEEMGELEGQLNELQSRIERLERVMATMRSSSAHPN